MDYEKHLYMIVHPNHSLIASQLEPDRFIKHYAQGCTRYFEGRLIFVEVDPEFRNPYFDIDTAYSELKPHEDGRPKATKFIKSYRVLEHMDYDAFGKLYISNSLGDYVELESKSHEPSTDAEEFRIMLEVNPVRFIVLTKLNYHDFAQFITDPRNTKGAPKTAFTLLEFDSQQFMKEYEENPLIRCYVPGIHPARLAAAIEEVRNTPGKVVKGISLDCPIDHISYKYLKEGFVFAEQNRPCKFYPYLDLGTIERKFYRFWKSM